MNHIWIDNDVTNATELCKKGDRQSVMSIYAEFEC